MGKVKTFFGRIRKKTGTVPVPGWLFVLGMVLYNELMLHFWSGAGFQPGRMLALIAFAMGFGGVLALLDSLLPSPKAGKWAAVIVSILFSVICLRSMY